jgi:hypothetical protein
LRLHSSALATSSISFGDAKVSYESETKALLQSSANAENAIQKAIPSDSAKRVSIAFGYEPPEFASSHASSFKKGEIDRQNVEHGATFKKGKNGLTFIFLLILSSLIIDRMNFVFLVLGGTNWKFGDEKVTYTSSNTGQMSSGAVQDGGYAERCKEMKAQKDRMRIKSVYFGSENEIMVSDQQKNFGWKSSSGTELEKRKVENKELKHGKSLFCCIEIKVLTCNSLIVPFFLSRIGSVQLHARKRKD